MLLHTLAVDMETAGEEEKKTCVCRCKTHSSVGPDYSLTLLVNALA